MKTVILFLIRFYRRFISPMFPPSCRFQPTCSRYCQLAFIKHGFFKGILLSLWRIVRCNPLNPKTGEDWP